MNGLLTCLSRRSNLARNDRARGGTTSGDAVSINKVRGLLYRLARLLGDVNAVEKGKVPQRVERRIVGAVHRANSREAFSVREARMRAGTEEVEL
jgi:hypothetical protein